MKLFKLLSTSILILLSSVTLDAQELTLGGVFNIGLSKSKTNYFGSGNFKSKTALSGNIGGFIEKKIKNSKSYFGIELLWIGLGGREEVKGENLYFYSGQEYELIGTISYETRITTSYLGIPIYLKYGIGKYGFKLGYQNMMLLFANSSYRSSGQSYNEPFTENSKRKGLKFIKYDLGIKVGIDYKLNSNMIFRVDYYYGLFNIVGEESRWRFRKNRQMSIGLNYSFWGWQIDT